VSAHNLLINKFGVTPRTTPSYSQNLKYEFLVFVRDPNTPLTKTGTCGKLVNRYPDFTSYGKGAGWFTACLTELTTLTCHASCPSMIDSWSASLVIRPRNFHLFTVFQHYYLLHPITHVSSQSLFTCQMTPTKYANIIIIRRQC